MKYWHDVLDNWYCSPPPRSSSVAVSRRQVQLRSAVVHDGLSGFLRHSCWSAFAVWATETTLSDTREEPVAVAFQRTSQRHRCGTSALCGAQVPGVPVAGICAGSSSTSRRTSRSSRRLIATCERRKRCLPAPKFGGSPKVFVFLSPEATAQASRMIWLPTVGSSTGRLQGSPEGNELKHEVVGRREEGQT